MSYLKIAIEGLERRQKLVMLKIEAANLEVMLFKNEYHIISEKLLSLKNTKTKKTKKKSIKQNGK